MSERIAIVGGTGREGLGLAARWSAAGHEVHIGSRDAQRASDRAAELNGARAEGAPEIGWGANHEVVPHADVVVLTVPWKAHRSTLEGLAGTLDGKLVIDITIPLAPPKVTQVSLPEGGSAAAQTKALVGGQAHVAVTLHHVSSGHLADPEHAFDCDVLVCADDPDARSRTMALVMDLGLNAIDAGVLANAVALESLTPVLLHINRTYGVKGAGIRVTGLES